MDDQVCPRCKTTKYRNPSLKLMVNVCGHTLCESCVELLFLKGSGSCPECNVALRRSNFRVQLFEDSNVDKEVQIRKRILKDFNKKEDDFTSLDEYNDYLEMIEELVFNLCNNIDIINTNKRIEQYKRDNRDVIMKNKMKLSKDELELEQIVEYEKEQFEQRRKELAMIEAENRKQKTKNKEELIDSLMASYEDASAIVDKFAQKAEQSQIQLPKPVAPPPVAAKQTHFSSGIATGFQGQHGFLAVPKLEEGPLFAYEPQLIETDGPAPPSLDEVINSGYIRHIRTENLAEKAGGFQTNISCLRAIQEALAGLYHGAKGDGPSSMAVETPEQQQNCFSRASELVAAVTSSSADESIVMEHGKSNEGICIDDTVFTLDDSGEIQENELRLTEDDDNNTTKDLDFSRTSPGLWSLNTPSKRARMMQEMQKSAERNGLVSVIVPVSCSTPFNLPVADRSELSSLSTTPSGVSPAIFQCDVEETPIQQQQPLWEQKQGQRTPWSSRSFASESKQAGNMKRQSITGAIDDLNEMTEELIDFIKGFEEKYSTAV
uniref:CDK-activating kinase assembly factor MAT1 n=1 Tax=Anopheles epiroticus TaxID=199890 RepID=A0A182NZG4_9DIPT